MRTRNHSRKAFVVYVACQIALGLSTFLIILTLLATSTKADMVYSYSGHLSQIPDSSLFAFLPENKTLTFPEGRNLFRLWGVDINHGEVPAELLNETLECQHVGSVFVNGFGDAFIVRCNGVSGDVSGWLIRNGYARELCAETSNLYGNCKLTEQQK